MKSYFAKLAARATLANAPAPRPVNARNAPDPFETTVASPEATPRAAWRSNPSFDQAPAKRGDLSESSQTIERRPQSQSNVTQAHETSPTLVPRSTEDQQSITEATTISELRPARDSSETRRVAHVESPDVNVTPTTEPHQLSPEAERSARQVPSTTSKEREKSSSPDDDKVNERLSNVENEQAVLLRKADTFMSGLFERRNRSREESKSEEREDEGQHRLARSETVIQPPTRLQPPSAPARVTEPADEEPSLVIANLSVEVVPAPAPAVTTQRQVVVIGGGRRTSTGIPSAHRFGFSRF